MTEDGKYYVEQYMKNTDFTRWDWQSLVNRFEPLFQANGFRERGDDKTATQVVAYMSGAVRRVGYSCNIAFVYGWPLVDDTQEKALMTDVYIIPAEIIHEAERAFYLLELLGMTVTAENIRLSSMQRYAEPYVIK